MQLTREQVQKDLRLLPHYRRMERSVQKVTPGIKVAKMIRKAEKQDLLIPVELACQLWPHHAAEEMFAEFGCENHQTIIYCSCYVA